MINVQSRCSSALMLLAQLIEDTEGRNLTTDETRAFRMGYVASAVVGLPELQQRELLEMVRNGN